MTDETLSPIAKMMREFKARRVCSACGGTGIRRGRRVECVYCDGAGRLPPKEAP